MFQKITTSFELVKISFSYIKRDGELLTYSVLSMLSSLAILVSFGLIGFFSGAFDQFLSNTDTQLNEESYNVLLYLGAFLYYLVFSFIAFFFNTAIITSVQRRNEGKDNTFGDGIRDAMKHIKQIFIWSIINALVSTILKVLQEKFWENSLIGKIIIWLVGGMWNILTFFSFPLMILQGLGVKDSIKESGALFKKTWGERAIIHVGISFAFFFIYLLVIFAGIGMIVSGFIFSGIAFIFVSVTFLAIFTSTCDTIIKTILLHYAQVGSLPAGLENETAITKMIQSK